MATGSFSHNKEPPRMLMADDAGRFFEHDQLLMTGQSWDEVLAASDIGPVMPLPPGSQMVFLPGRKPVGIDPTTGKPCILSDTPGAEGAVHAVAAVLPPGHLRLALPAYRRTRHAPELPFRAYTAVGWQNGKLVVLAKRQDPRRHWDPKRFDRDNLERKIQQVQRQHPGNQVLAQLAHCVRDYSCCTASNMFLGRYEAGLPVAPHCNARCLGCISKQPAGTSPQQRLLHPPRLEHLVEIAVAHLKASRPAMVSFGQGCEGEPLTEADTVVEVIRRIRAQTKRGSIHLNTNGSRPEVLEQLARAGLNSIRVSMLSARPKAFRAYHRGTFGLGSVETFLAQGVELGLYVAINLLVFPGFTDRRPGEIEALVRLLKRTHVHMVQLRNLDIDPDRFIRRIKPAHGKPMGMLAFLDALRRQVPWIDLGCFNRFKEEYAKSSSG